MNFTKATVLSLLPLLTLAGCGDEVGLDDMDGSETQTADADGDDGDGGDGDDGHGEGAEDEACACDVSVECDEGCECDLACEAVVGEPPLGLDTSMLGRSELVMLHASGPDQPLDRMTAFDDMWVPDADDLPLPSGMQVPIAQDQAVAGLELAGIDIEPSTLRFDLDDDGDDEVLVADAYGVRALDIEGTHVDETTLISFSNPLERTMLAAGDVDSDGIPELAVGAIDGGEMTWDVYTVDRGSLERLGGGKVHSVGAVRDGDIGLGDVDADGRDELIVAWMEPNGVSWQRFHFGTHAEIFEADAVARALDGGFDEDCTLALEIGEVDGKAGEDGVLAVRAWGTFEAVLGLYVGADPGMAHAERRWEEYVHPGSISRPSLALADVGTTGPGPHSPLPDGRLEPLLAYAKWNYDDPSAPPELFVIMDAGGDSVISHKLYATGMEPRIAAADTDLDGVAELALSFRGRHLAPTFPLEWENNGYNLMRLDPRLSAQSRLELVSVALHAVGTDDGGEWAAAAVPTFADVDADGLRVRATGEVRRVVGQPHVNAILAAPPTWVGNQDIVQDGDSGTSLGAETTTETSKSEQIGARASLGLSAGATFMDVIEYEVQLTASVEVSRTQTNTHSESYGSERTVGPDDHGVIFRMTPYASHVYEVMAHPDQDLVGTLISIDVPGESREYKWTITQFIDVYGTDSLPIELLAQDIGNPHTYKPGSNCNQSSLTQLLPEGSEVTDVYKTERRTVGNTGGTDTLYVSVSDQVSDETALGLGIDLSTSTKSFNNGYEASVGLFTEHTNEVTIGESVTYSGTVSDIDGPVFDDGYDWGLCVYHYKGAYGHFPVIDYYVD